MCRNNYSAAKLQGLIEDLNMTGDQYQTGLSILFVGYLLMQIPSNLLLNYMGRPSLYLGFWICVWGLVSALTSQVQSYGGIVAARFILGFVGMSDLFLPQYTVSIMALTDLPPTQRHPSSAECCFTCRDGTPEQNYPSA